MSGIPKTLKEIYISVLVHGNKISSDGTKVYEHENKDPRSFFQKLITLRPKVIKTYILVPTEDYMKHAIPNKDKIHFQKFENRLNGSVPICKYAWCGRNIEFGYKYCEEHGLWCICNICKKYESDMCYNGERRCWGCHGRTCQ